MGFEHSSFVLGQVGADPKAFVFGSMLFLGLVALAVIVLAVVIALILFAFMSSTPQSSHWRKHVAVFSVIAIAVSIGAAFVWFNMPRGIEFNLSNSRQLTAVGWPPQLDKDSFSYLGHLDIKLSLPGNLHCDGRFNRVWIDREGDQVQRLQLFSDSLTLEAACTRIRQLAADWQINVSHLNNWKVNAATGDLSRFTAGIPVSTSEPGLWLNIIPSIGTPDTPWYVMIEIYWKPNPTQPLIDGETKKDSP